MAMHGIETLYTVNSDLLDYIKSIKLQLLPKLMLVTSYALHYMHVHSSMSHCVYVYTCITRTLFYEDHHKSMFLCVCLHLYYEDLVL